MIGHLPKRPAGTSARARFAQWVYDTLTGPARPQASPTQKLSATTKGFFIEPKVVDETSEDRAVGTHLTDAIWHPELDRIYGVRGGYLVECDADGNLLRTLTYSDPAMGDAYLVLHTNGMLWISSWCDPSAGFQDDYPMTERNPQKGFFVLNPEIFADPVLFSFSSTVGVYETEFVSVAGVPPVPNLLERVTGHADDTGDDDTTEELPTTTGGAIAYIDLHDAFPLEAAGAPFLPDPYTGDVLTIGPFSETCQMSAGPFRVYGGFKLNGVHQHAEIATFKDIGSWLMTIPAGEVVTIEIVAGFEFAGFATQAEMDVITGDPAYVQNTRLGFFNSVTVDGGEDRIKQWQFQTGPRRVLLDNDGLLWTAFLGAGTIDENKLGFAVFDGPDPTSAGLIAFGGGFLRNTPGNLPGPCALNCLALDTDNNEVWGSLGTGIVRLTIDGNHVEFDQVTYITDDSEPTLGVYGMCYFDGRIFIATRTPIVYVVDLGDLSVDTIDLGLEGATPRNIRFAQDRLWVPTMTDDRVVEIDPDTYAIEDVHVGFDQPWDIVATDSKVFAVQLGSPGLRLIR